MRVLILSAKVKYLKGELEHEKEDYEKALSYYTEGLELKCKDDKINAKLYLRRSHSHNHLGELTRLFFFFFFFFSFFYKNEFKILTSKCENFLLVLTDKFVTPFQTISLKQMPNNNRKQWCAIRYIKIWPEALYTLFASRWLVCRCPTKNP